MKSSLGAEAGWLAASVRVCPRDTSSGELRGVPPAQSAGSSPRGAAVVVRTNSDARAATIEWRVRSRPIPAPAIPLGPQRRPGGCGEPRTDALGSRADRRGAERSRAPEPPTCFRLFLNN